MTTAIIIIRSSKYPELKSLVKKPCTMCGSTYVREVDLSMMNFINNNFRSRFSDGHLSELMEIIRTIITPNITGLAGIIKRNFSLKKMKCFLA